MAAIYPSSALKSRQREIKDLAEREPVYITEHGRGKYVFLSEEVLDQMIAQAVEDALYDERLAEALAESREDFAAGRSYGTREDLMAAVARKRTPDAAA